MTQTGNWMVWWHQPGGTWASRELDRGFPLGAPVRISTETATGFAVDLRGRVIAAIATTVSGTPMSAGRTSTTPRG